MTDYMTWSYAVTDLDDVHQQRMSRLLMWMAFDRDYAEDVLDLVLYGKGCPEELSKYFPGDYHPDDEEADQ